MSVKRDEFLDFLEDYLMEEEAKELEIKITGEEEEDGPLIDSIQKANYFVKLVSKIKEDIDSINLLCNEEIEKVTDKINVYRQSQIKPLENQMAYYSKLLQNFTEKELADSNKRSIKLPYGTLSMKKQQPKWEYGDEKELVKLLKENNLDNLVSEKVTYSLDKKTFKDVVIVTDNGVVLSKEDKTFIPLPGVTVVDQGDKFTIKI